MKPFFMSDTFVGFHDLSHPASLCEGEATMHTRVDREAAALYALPRGALGRARPLADGGRVV